MSRIIAYIKFPDNSIVCGCYHGTSDHISPWLITQKNLYDRYDGDIFAFDDDQYANYDERCKDPKSISDSETVELWIYGSDFMYECMASKSEMYITSGWKESDSGKEIDEWVRKILGDDYSEL